VLPEFGPRPVGSLRTTDVREFKDALVRRGLSASGVWYASGPLRRALDLAVEDNAIPANPAASVSLTTDAKLARPRFRAHFLTEQQVEALCGALAERQPYDVMVRLLAWTGLRAGELAGLNVGDVRLWRSTSGWGGYLDVHRTRRKVKGGWVEDTPKSERSNRRVDLQDWLAEDLHAYLTATHPRGDDPDAPLFPGRRKGGYTHGRRGAKRTNSEAHAALNWREPVEPAAFYRNVFKPALAAAGLPPGVRLHDLRHTYASLALSRAASPYWVSEQMGHSSYKITLDVYAHFIPKDDAHPLNGRPGARRLGVV
jgi:integrase